MFVNVGCFLGCFLVDGKSCLNSVRLALSTSVKRGLKSHKLEAKIAPKTQFREGLLIEMQTVNLFHFTIRNLWSGPRKQPDSKTSFVWIWLCPFCGLSSYIVVCMPYLHIYIYTHTYTHPLFCIPGFVNLNASRFDTPTHKVGRTTGFGGRARQKPGLREV